ncbi:MAG: UDP-N-acetylmuramoyl-L-alanyl-D-glutamate--2,6-diaminopimelate ligase [Acidobacteriota bacterium]
MDLHQLFDGVEGVRMPAANPQVVDIHHDSRVVGPGSLFVAIVGERFDGRTFLGEAARRGAVAALGPGPAPAECDLPWVQVAEPRALLGPLAVRLFGDPHQRLTLVGVTGTNGKSTVTSLVAAILEAAGRPTGTLGTLGRSFGEISYGPSRTTPEADDVFRTLEEMRAAGAQAAVMEVSSHALSLGRVAGARYDVAVFTNLTRDHLDFHGDLESYFAAKCRLFEQLKPGGCAVVSLGDAYGRRLAERLQRPVTFGAGGSVEAVEVELDFAGIRGVLATPRGELRFETTLIGRYNLENLQAAVAVAEALEIPQSAISAGLAAQQPVPGRLEAVDSGQSFPALVDFAHTPAALEAALRSVRELSDRDIVLVFGCGGDRDPGKRPLMGRIAGELASTVVITSDNPRTEDPQAILRGVEEGVRASGNREYRIVPDRREAIRRAASLASKGHRLVLVAGRGNEGFQLIANQRIPFDDRQELADALSGALGAGHLPLPAAAGPLEACDG